MSSFMKVLVNNLLKGPSTDPFPAGDTFTPERQRGKCVIDPELCMGCGVCQNSCAAGAINIARRDDGFSITVWRDSCCLCASCRHYCPTGAMSIANDWRHVHEDKDKFKETEQHDIKYEPCQGCGAPMRPLPLKLAQKIYANNGADPDELRHLCPVCRQSRDAHRQEKAEQKTAAQEES